MAHDAADATKSTFLLSDWLDRVAVALSNGQKIGVKIDWKDPTAGYVP
jgi:hypothetical protein